MEGVAVAARAFTVGPIHAVHGGNFHLHHLILAVLVVDEGQTAYLVVVALALPVLVKGGSARGVGNGAGNDLTFCKDSSWNEGEREATRGRNGNWHSREF